MKLPQIVNKLAVVSHFCCDSTLIRVSNHLFLLKPDSLIFLIAEVEALQGESERI